MIIVSQQREDKSQYFSISSPSSWLVTLCVALRCMTTIWLFYQHPNFIYLFFGYYFVHTHKRTFNWTQHENNKMGILQSCELFRIVTKGAILLQFKLWISQGQTSQTVIGRVHNMNRADSSFFHMLGGLQLNQK
jgi:hypothetical protein